MKKINILSVFLLYSTIQTLSSNQGNQQESYTAYLDQRIQEKDMALRRKEEHRLVRLENAKKIYETINERYNREYKEAYAEYIISKYPDKVCQDCIRLANSRYCIPLIFSSITAASFLGNNIANLSKPGEKHSCIEDVNAMGFFASMASTCFICRLLGIECLEESIEIWDKIRKKNNNFEFLQMHTIPTSNSNRDKMV
jgi:hypothetical protein